MNFYRVPKVNLKWKDITQLDYTWKMPILIDKDFNVILGNSLKDKLPDNIIVVVCHNNDRELLFQSLFEIETAVAEENDEKRLNKIQVEIRDFFRETKKEKVEYMDLFNIREDREVSVENYVEPPNYDFNKHGKGRELFNENNLLFEEFMEVDKTKEKECDIEIDMEIMKELL